MKLQEKSRSFLVPYIQNPLSFSYGKDLSHGKLFQYLLHLVFLFQLDGSASS